MTTHANYQPPLAFGIGVATVDSRGKLLDCYFPSPYFQSNLETAALLAKLLGYERGTCSYELTSSILNDFLHEKSDPDISILQQILTSAKPGQKKIMLSFIGSGENDPGPQGVADAYLRLHLLSHRLVKPHGINLTGIFKILPNVVWTSEGPIGLEDLNQKRIEAILAGRHMVVHSIDKFPRMVDYVLPTDVRIADASRVRLGAYLGEGTTIMHEGFVNFNAGCEGPNMIEGRISSGVFVKKGSDLGGGCSTMGTLSGGGSEIITIDENCLLGANSGLGIPLGKRCTVEAGLYLTAGMKILFEGQIVKAKELAGKDDVLFRRNSQTGQVEAIIKKNTVELNEMLHANS